MICPDCGGEFKNLGAHKRFCKYTTEQPLNSIISEVEQVLKKVSHKISIHLDKTDGVVESVEITARFRPRR